MKTGKIPDQGDIIWVNFNPVRGHEQGGTRPALVISNNKFNLMCGGTVKVIPITSSSKAFPLNIDLPKDLPVYGKLKLAYQNSLDVLSRGYKYSCSVPEDYLEKIIQIVKSTIEKS